MLPIYFYPTVLARRPYEKLSELYLHSAAGAPPLRVGILLDGWVTTRMYAEVLRDVQACDFAAVELIIVTKPEAAAAESSPGPPPVKMLGAALWNLYCRWDQRRRSRLDDPMAAADCRELLAGIPVLHVTPLFESGVRHFPDQAVAAVRSYRLDVVLDFGSVGPRGQILQAMSYGIWKFQHGSSDFYRGGPPYFREMAEANPLAGTELHAIVGVDGAAFLLQRALFATQPSNSLLRQRLQPCWSSEHLVIQKLWEIHQYGWERVARRKLSTAASAHARTAQSAPTNWEMFRWLSKALPRKVAGKLVERLRGPRVDHWRIAIRGPREPAATLPLDMAGFRWVESPRGHLYADPFLFEQNGRQHLFFEDWSYEQHRAVIAHAELSPDGQMGPVRTVLDTGKHASYPCVFAGGDAVYMLPETAKSGGVRIFRATRFPDEWKEEAQPFLGTAVDTSVCNEDGTWYFFTTLRDPRAQGTALYLFWSESPVGQWNYHPSNPISFDVRRARCAGNLFRHGGMLIRPSQDCSGRYGRAFALNHILKISRQEYEEEVLQVVEPDWAPGLISTHTYNRSGKFEVTDGQIWRPWAAVR